MNIKEIQDGIVNQIGFLYVDDPENEQKEEQFFTHDIYKCNDLFDLIDILVSYGYDKQGALGILNTVILK